ncbi:MAG: GH92 family glycosyl hydrolase [Porphyromonas sp.]|nr:GH92 family glycosyl hydrolase [Porphyromonas sp.]
MKRILTILLPLLPLLASAQCNEASPVDYVSILVGTDSEHALSAGNTYPAVAMPWGMNFWTPQTGEMGNGWQYTYGDKLIRGIKQTHQPSPWMNDYGNFVIMPITGEGTVDEEERASWFSHKAEVAAPYLYSVYLADHDVEVSLAPTERSAIFEISYPQDRPAHLVIDALDMGSYIQVIPEERKVVGFSTRNSGGVPENFRNYFTIHFDIPFTASVLHDRGEARDGVLSLHSEHAALLLSFPEGETIEARVSSSFISPEQAEINLRELDGRTITEVAEAGKARWNDVLGRVEIEDPNVDNLRTFYSTLYRSLLFPRRFYEINEMGEVYHYSPYNGEVLPGYMYTDTGFWDTFRSLFPLLNLLYPDENLKMQEGLVNAFKESNFLPEWASPGHRDIMVGNNSASVVADAYLKGVRVAEPEMLWEAVVHGANHRHPTVKATGRYGHEYYNTLGYVPYDVDINESAARTLEYAYNDWCIWQLGKALGKPEHETAIYRQRAENYKNLFDPEHHLMRGKNKDGSWQTPFNPLKWGDAFTEGNSWHYTWSVFHDPAGLIALMGGAKRFNQMLDSVFAVPPLFDDSYYGFVIHEIREMQIMNMGNYAHGNQPIQHMIYLYNYGGEPWKAQYWTREVMDRLYSANPDGYCGDEDNGQTSAWYVFSAMGFYPVCPGTDQYAIGSPLFRKMTLHMPSGKKLELEAPNNCSEHRYIQSITINGMPSTRNYFTYEELQNGGTIIYEMSAEPNTERGTTPIDAPYSMSLHE